LPEGSASCNVCNVGGGGGPGGDINFLGAA
jgi:hypothetical protein